MRQTKGQLGSEENEEKRCIDYSVIVLFIMEGNGDSFCNWCYILLFVFLVSSA